MMQMSITTVTIVKKVKMMNSEKIIALADFLDTLPRYRFNMRNWASRFDNDEYLRVEKFYNENREKYGNLGEDVFIQSNESFFGLNDSLDINVCNTAGCIAGWAIAMDSSGSAIINGPFTPYDAEIIVMRGAVSLGLSYIQANRLFYTARGDSVWCEDLEKYVDKLDPYSFQNVMEEVDFTDEYHYETVVNLFDRNLIVITNSVAAHVLRLIVSGDIAL